MHSGSNTDSRIHSPVDLPPSSAGIAELLDAPVEVSAVPVERAVAEGPDHGPDGPKFRFSNLDWTAAGPILALHVACIAAPFFFSWSALGVSFVLWWLSGGLGVCLCYHRLLTHRSFKTPKWFEYTLTILATLCWQGGPIKWVGEHRIHHKHSDHEHDPHSPKHGFNWAHAFWAVSKIPAGYEPRNAAKDLQRDKVTAWIDRNHALPQFVLMGLLMLAGTLIGGWMLGLGWVVWGVAVRTVFTYHATWLNNHHHAQRAAAHGQRWFEFDITYQTIRLLKLVGLARDIVPVKH
ncbi:MAG: fatty acid desaturase [Phycisphaerales bacterium]|nr:fatty acid desaturase [Phycisphaerales bacterium]